MDCKEIIYNVCKGLDPDYKIEISIASDTDLDEAHFVVADIHYSKDGDETTMHIPFVVYSETEVFMPYDWQAELPEKAEDIGNTSWVSYPSHHQAIIMNGLPRLFAGDF